MVLAAILARLPAQWVDLAWGHEAPVRVLLALISVASGKVLATVVYSRLPASAFLLRGTLAFPERGRKAAVRVSTLREVRIELRPEPAREVIVVVDEDGVEHDVCPVHWAGAGGLYDALRRAVDRGNAGAADHT